MVLRETLVAALGAALEQARQDGLIDADALPRPQLGVPPTAELGDFSSDVAALAARSSRKSPSELAQALAERLALPESVDRVEVSPSGILNFRLKQEWLHDAVRAACRNGAEYGRTEGLGGGRSVLLEFVSADPTAPLNANHGRGAAVGDALAGVLQWSGFRVTREYYVNDAGSQMERFGRSLETLLSHREGAAGHPLAEVARGIGSEAGAQLGTLTGEARLAEVTRLGRDAMVARHRETLERLGVRLDVWRSERELQDGGTLAQALSALRESGEVYEQDGALWLRASASGDTEDRPLVRSNGKPTYLAGDLAYHLDKAQRGFDLLIDLWGPEHAPYVPRTVAAMRTLGLPAELLQILIFQPVTVRATELAAETLGSSGNNLLLDEVIERVGADNARFAYLSRPISAPLELDLDAAGGADEASLGRIRNVIAQLRERSGSAGSEGADLSQIGGDAGRLLMRRIADLTDELRAAARDRDPHRVARYVAEIATTADEFLRESAAAPASAAHACLGEAAATTLANGLAVLNIRATD